MLKLRKTDGAAAHAPRYPGTPTALDGSAAVVEMETAGGEAAGAYPITPSTQMGEGFAAAVAAGTPNVHGRRLVFFEPEGEHAAAAVTAGLSMTGLRATNFSSGQGIAYMHESLYAAVGKRLTYVLNVACRAMTKHALNVHAGHDDYHAVDDTGFFQLFAKDVQESADFNLVAHRVAELSLNPGICAQDGFLTSHVIESLRLPERDLVREYLGAPEDQIDCPTPAQRLVFGEQRRRIPEMFDVDYPAMLGVVQNQDAYAQGVAAQRPFYFDHVRELTDRAFDEFAALTGRRYARAVGYRLEDAEYVIAGQGSVVANAEAVVDWLRREKRWKVGVLNVAMFRPFPTDLVSKLLRGKRAVTVLERVDQPLAVDPPLLRELRAAMGQALENGRARGAAPHPGVTPCRLDELPDFYSGCFGLGSRDLQPADLVATFRNMLAEGAQRRLFYLGVDFVRRGTRLPKLQLWQQELLDAYPHLEHLTLPAEADVDLLPAGATSIRIHSIGGWGAITTGKNLAVTASELLGLCIKANPKYGSEKKGQPTTFYATLASEPVKLNCELRHVDVVLSPDPNVFRHGDPLSGLEPGGVFVIQSDQTPEKLWASLPRGAQRTLRERRVRVFAIDAFAIAASEASNAELRYRMQGAAFMGAFFRVAHLPGLEQLDEAAVMAGIEARVRAKFGKLGERVVADNMRVIRRGYEEVVELDVAQLPESGTSVGELPVLPMALDNAAACAGIGNPGRFWEQVGHLYRSGEDGIADPFAAISALPAATSSIRDMTDVRFEVPVFHADKCTGCSRCWVQCPDAAIPGLVSTAADVLEAAVAAAEDGRPLDRIRQALKPLAKETHRALAAAREASFPDALRNAYEKVAPKLAPDPERRAALDADFARVALAVSEFPLARTAPFFELPENREKGTGGLLSVVVNPQACKGCNICVEVCPDGALTTVKQDADVVERLRRTWEFRNRLPDTDDRYVQVTDLDEGIGVLSSLLLKKENYQSMVGGDGACMGCGEKTAVHLVLSAVQAAMQPVVARHVARLDALVEALDTRARQLVAAHADVETAARGGSDAVHVAGQDRTTLERITLALGELRDLRWRYVEGPSGRGRARVGFANATGCSSVWGSTYPYNPYPFPWVNHLFQDAPSIAIGVFEGHMRKMAAGFVAVRRAQKLLDGTYDPATDEEAFRALDWRGFDDDEFALCPPIFAVGGDGAMLDIGFQNLSRLLASGKPVRVMVLDTQVYSNTGGQACTSGFTGQVSDMAAFGPAQRGKEETRKELSLLVMAHRGAYLLQSSQAAPAHLLGGVLKGLHARRPAVFVLHCPCPPEHGIADDSAAHQAKLALESRAFVLVRYDPDAGPELSDRLSLDGNPSPDTTWPSYQLTYVDAAGAEQTLELPLTIADWAATEARFAKHFKRLADDDVHGLVPFHEYLELSQAERDGKTPYLQARRQDRRLVRMSVSPEIVALAEERLGLWHQLRQMAGEEPPRSVEAAVQRRAEAEFAARERALREEYEARLAALRASYPQEIARKLATGLLRSGAGGRTIAEALAEAARLPVDALQRAAPVAVAAPVAAAPAAAQPAAVAVAVAAAPAAAAEPAAADDDFALEAYIESARCTACNECTNLNNRLFSYNEKKQAYVKDARAGTFKQLVMAAERCPVSIIHPGTPLDPTEPDLDKWTKRAERFR